MKTVKLKRYGYPVRFDKETTEFIKLGLAFEEASDNLDKAIIQLKVDETDKMIMENLK